jgi:hypothetical protein
MKSILGKLVIILIGLAIFGNAEVWGADWKIYGKDAYYDVSSIIRQPDGSVRVWTKWVHFGEKVSMKEAWDKWLRISESQGEEQGRWFLSMEVTKESFHLREINCSKRSFRNLAFEERDKKGITVLGALSKANPEEAMHIPPDSSMELLLKAICK